MAKIEVVKSLEMQAYEKARNEAAEKRFFIFVNPVREAPISESVTDVEGHFKAGADWASRYWHLTAVTAGAQKDE